MGLTYFKRFRMEAALRLDEQWSETLPEGYRFVVWEPSLLSVHAETKFLSFRSELDANVFPCLGELSGCLRLMTEISRKPGFLPEATWLVEYDGAGPHKREYCGTIQGIRDEASYGGIQNLGITPHHRGRGLGSALMRCALAGFHRAGLSRVYLEVTAQNEGAIRLYKRMGFKRARTTYKAVEVAYT
ncbi:MAG: GNAT family N-acetyltransferase [Pirellulales bacterium]